MWVNVMQVVLILIMLGQAYLCFFDHEAWAASGVSIEGTPSLNIIYETGSRLLVMVVAAIYVIITQNARQWLVVLLMNIVREGQEMFIDPLFPVANAPASPVMDFGIHVAIVGVEIAAFLAVLAIARQQRTPGAGRNKVDAVSQ
jgi:hypothetical protein